MSTPNPSRVVNYLNLAGKGMPVEQGENRRQGNPFHLERADRGPAPDGRYVQTSSSTVRITSGAYDLDVAIVAFRQEQARLPSRIWLRRALAWKSFHRRKFSIEVSVVSMRPTIRFALARKTVSSLSSSASMTSSRTAATWPGAAVTTRS